MPYIERAGTRLFYSESGDGPPMLLIHGWSCDGNDWHGQIPAFEEKHRVLVMDSRGHGRSGEASDGDYTIQGYAADAAAVLEAAGASNAVVMGHSLGVAIALELATQRPDLVRAIVDVDGALTAPEQARAVLGGLLGAVEAAPQDTVAAFFAGSFYPPASPAWLKAWHLRRVYSGSDSMLLETARTLFDENGRVYQSVTSPLLGALNVPVLGFHVAPAAAAWLRTQLKHPASKVVEWEGTGHFAHVERPLELNSIALEWLEAVG
jgi:pimeloyl-ACP methyl ester carboxylesterase